MNTAHPQRRSQVANSRWTNIENDVLFKHFDVEYVRKDGIVRLRAVLDREYGIECEWRSLRDRSAWQPGWSTP